jgi:hypothetical protein
MFISYVFKFFELKSSVTESQPSIHTTNFITYQNVIIITFFCISGSSSELTQIYKLET